MQYETLAARGTILLDEFKEKTRDVPYEAKGILNSELLFLLSCLPYPFRGRVLESGRARAQSTLVLSLMLPQSNIISIELSEESSDVPIAAERMRGRDNVTLLFGNAETMLAPMAERGDVVLIDGPKMFRAIRLAIRLLATKKVSGVFIHDIRPGRPERKFLDQFFPEALFSDRRRWASAVAFLDDDALKKGSHHPTLQDFEGEYGYGFTLTYIPLIPGKSYRFWLLISYFYDAIHRIIS